MVFDVIKFHEVLLSGFTFNHGIQKQNLLIDTDFVSHVNGYRKFNFSPPKIPGNSSFIVSYIQYNPHYGQKPL